MRKFNFKRVMTLVLSIVLMLTVIPCGAFTVSAAAQPTFNVNLSEQIGTAAITRATLYTNTTFNVALTVDRDGVVTSQAGATGYTGNELMVSGSYVSGSVPAAKGVAFAVVVTTSDGAVHVFGYGVQISGNKIVATGGTSWGTLEAKEYTTFLSMTQVQDGKWLTLKPAARDKVLIWYGNSGEYTKYSTLKNTYQNMSLTVEEMDETLLTSTFPTDLSGYGLVWIWLPNQSLSNSAVSSLKEYVTAGGVVVLQGEHSGFAEYENPILSKLASDLGGSFAITDGKVSGSSVFNFSASSSLFTNIESGASVYANWAADIEVGIGTTPIASVTGTDEDTTQQRTVNFIVEQEVGNGYLIGTSDINWYHGQTNTTATQLLKNMYTYSVENIEQVSKDKVLLWSTGLEGATTPNNTAGGNYTWGINSFNAAADMFSAAVPGITVTKMDGGTMPTDLSDYSLVWIHLPAITEADYAQKVNVDALKAYINKGGRVVIVSETAMMMGSYNAGITALAQALGGNVTIAAGDSNSTSAPYTFNGDSKLTESVAGVTGNTYPGITVSGNALWVAKDANGAIAIVDQAVSQGRLTVMTDFNWYCTNYDAITSNAGAVRLFKNLVTDTKANMATVAAGGDPNADFGVVTVSTADELDRALANAVPGVKTTIKLSATVTASRGNGEGLGSAGARFNIDAGKDITIDLNGYNIEYDDNGGTGSPATLKNNGTLTVINSSNTPAAIKGTEKAVNNCGSLTVKGDSVGDISLIGTGNQGLEVGPSSKNDIDGATIIGAYAAICDQSKGVNDDDDKRASVNIKNAYLECTLAENCVVWGFNSIGGGVYTFGNNVTMKLVGGTGTDKLVYLDENSAISVCLSSGTLSYKDNGNGVYTIVQNPSVNNIDELAEAIKNAADGAVVKLEGDIEGHIEIPAGKNVVLDLNGHKFENTNGRPITNYGTLKVIDSSEGQTGALTGSTHGIWNFGTLIVEAGTITGTQNEAIINDRTDTSVTVTGGTLRGGYAAICDYDANGTVVLSNCVLEGLGGEWVISSFGANKGGSYTINPGVVLKNEKNPTQLINTDNGVATNDKQVAVANWDEIVIENGTVKVNTAPVLSDLEKAYNTAKGNIKATEGLTDAQRTALLDKLDKEYAAAKKAVGEANTYADAVAAKKSGIEKMTAYGSWLGVEKASELIANANKTIDKDYISVIEGLANIGQAEKDALIAKMAAAQEVYLNDILNAASDDDVLTAANKLVDALKLIIKKGKAADEIAAAAKEEIKKIENANNLNDTKKKAWKAQVNKAYADAFAALLDAENSDIDNIKSDALETLKGYGNTVANEDIVQLVNDKAAAADSLRKNAEDAKKAIDAMSNLSDARKTELKNAIDEAVEAAEDAIMATNSSADAQKALDGGKDAIANIKATAEREDVKSPQTGDNSYIYLWMSIMLISLATLVLLYKKKALLSK